MDVPTLSDAREMAKSLGLLPPPIFQFHTNPLPPSPARYRQNYWMLSGNNEAFAIRETACGWVQARCGTRWNDQKIHDSFQEALDAALAMTLETDGAEEFGTPHVDEGGIVHVRTGYYGSTPAGKVEANGSSFKGICTGGREGVAFSSQGEAALYVASRFMQKEVLEVASRVEAADLPSDAPPTKRAFVYYCVGLEHRFRLPPGAMPQILSDEKARNTLLEKASNGQLTFSHAGAQSTRDWWNKHLARQVKTLTHMAQSQSRVSNEPPGR